jgi:hypothetical protein
MVLPLGWLPYVGLALAIIGFIATVVSQIIIDRGYAEIDYVKKVIRTDVGDGFAWWIVSKGNDYYVF